MKIAVLITLYVIGGIISATIISAWGLIKNKNEIDVEFLSFIGFITSWYSCSILVLLAFTHVPFFVTKKILKRMGK